MTLPCGCDPDGDAPHDLCEQGRRLWERWDQARLLARLMKTDMERARKALQAHLRARKGGEG